MPEDTASDRLMVSVHYVDNAMYWSKKIGGQEWLDYTDALPACFSHCVNKRLIQSVCQSVSLSFAQFNKLSVFVKLISSTKTRYIRIRLNVLR